MIRIEVRAFANQGSTVAATSEKAINNTVSSLVREFGFEFRYVFQKMCTCRVDKRI